MFRFYFIFPFVGMYETKKGAYLDWQTIYYILCVDVKSYY